jgi:hypothetical protein
MLLMVADKCLANIKATLIVVHSHLLPSSFHRLLPKAIKQD